MTVAGSVAVNCITILYQNGTGKKSISALLSVGAVMLALLVFVFWIGGKMHIGGLNEIDMKSDLSLYYSFNIHGGYADGRHIHDYHRATGSGEDSAVAISSSIYEVYDNNPDLGTKELFESGIAMGKDVMATTLNTLYFAYIGEALMLILYLRQYHYSLVSMLNAKAFLQDFACIVISAIGCILVIPVCAGITAKILKEQ